MTLTELLVEIFEVPIEKAKIAAKVKSLEDISRQIKDLESYVGENTAYAIIKNGEFITYTNGQLKEYKALLQEAVTTLKDQFSHDGNLNIQFANKLYSIETLKEFLSKKDEITEQMMIDKDKLLRYRIFNPTNESSRKYLSSLIDTGELEVGRFEFWTKYGNQKSADTAMGTSILKKMAFELSLAFRESGYDDPKIILNHANRKLTIAAENIDTLRILRDHAYNS